MTLRNKFNIESSVELARAEERISKQKAIALWQSDELKNFQAGTFAALLYIHKRLFEDISAKATGEVCGFGLTIFLSAN